MNHRLRRRAKRTGAAVSALSPCRILFFSPMFFCLIVSRYLDDAIEQLIAGVVQNFGEESENHCTIQKEKRGKVLLWSFGLTNKNIPVKRARLPGFSWFRMSLFCGAGSQPIRAPRLPQSVVWNTPPPPPPLRFRCQQFSYSCHSLILHFPPWPQAVSTFISKELRRAAQPVEQ